MTAVSPVGPSFSAAKWCAKRIARVASGVSSRHDARAESRAAAEQRKARDEAARDSEMIFKLKQYVKFVT